MSCWPGLLTARRLGRAATLLAVVAVIGAALLAIQRDPAKAAAIIDQLVLSQPNADFVAETTRTLEKAGYVVDYYGGEEVTVDLYRELPSLDYDLIILRTHVGRTRRVDSATGEVTWPEYVSVFTGESFTNRDKYPRQGVGEGVPYDGGPAMYAITAAFIEHTMNGTFDHTVIVLMGCDGLRSDATAEAFIARGAGAVVGWSDAVTASHTDTATGLLLDRVVAGEQPLVQAVRGVADSVGPDPYYGGELEVLATGS